MYIGITPFYTTWSIYKHTVHCIQAFPLSFSCFILFVLIIIMLLASPPTFATEIYPHTSPLFSDQPSWESNNDTLACLLLSSNDQDLLRVIRAMPTMVQHHQHSSFQRQAKSTSDNEHQDASIALTRPSHMLRRSSSSSITLMSTIQEEEE